MSRALRVLQQRDAAVSARVRAAVLDSPDDLAAACAHRELDREIARVLARDPSGSPACSAGCSYCCHVHVDATGAEVQAIASEVEARAGFVERLAAHVRVVSAMTDSERWSARIPCALLGEDGKCTIYDVRPLRCRAFHSRSADACREAFTGPSEPAPQLNLALERACEAAEAGYAEALEARGISAAPGSLEIGLLAALCSRKVGSRL